MLLSLGPSGKFFLYHLRPNLLNTQKAQFPCTVVKYIGYSSSVFSNASYGHLLSLSLKNYYSTINLTPPCLDHRVPPSAGVPDPPQRGPRQDAVLHPRGDGGRRGGVPAPQGGGEAVRHRPTDRPDRPRDDHNRDIFGVEEEEAGGSSGAKGKK